MAESSEPLSGETAHVVCFRLGDEEYGIDIARVQEINRMIGVTRVPHAPEFMKGVINLRGQLVPIVDLRVRFGMPPSEPTKSTRIVVTEVGRGRVGLVVDGVSEVLKIPVEHIEPAPAMMSEVESAYIRGVGKYADRLIVLLELGAIVAAAGTTVEPAP